MKKNWLGLLLKSENRLIAVIGLYITFVLSLMALKKEQWAQAFGYSIAGFVLIVLAFLFLSWLQKYLVRREIWKHFSQQIKEKDEDFLIHTFSCPNEKKHSDSNPDPEDVEDEKVDKHGRLILTAKNVLRLWADAEGSAINALIEEENEEKHLQVTFNNHKLKDYFAANITIRPGGDKAYERDKDQDGKNTKRFLKIEAKIPSDINNDLEEVCMCFRIIDRLDTHWFYKQDGRYIKHIVKFKGDDGKILGWQPFNIDLDNPKKWEEVFSSDGNHRYHRKTPDFDDVILAVVIEMGSVQGQNRPGPGKGRVLIRNPYYSK
jgi:hypothetical protein